MVLLLRLCYTVRKILYTGERILSKTLNRVNIYPAGIYSSILYLFYIYRLSCTMHKNWTKNIDVMKSNVCDIKQQ